ncbi:MAG: ATP-binding protein [Candidatus Dojkabacteria bacterium]|nr:MAG: ATP-binding protein [Candidatus Dojkabacteria bacterium]
MSTTQPFEKDPNRFTKTHQSKTQQMIDKRNETLDPGKKINDFQRQVKEDRLKTKELEDKERYDPTVIKKRSPLQNFLAYLPVIGKNYAPKNDEEQIAAEEQAVDGRKIEGLTIEDLIAPIDMEVDFNHLKIGDWYFQTYFVSPQGYPRFVGPNWLSPIINFEHSLYISTFYYPVDSKVILQKLKRKIGEMEATLYSQMEGRKAVDPTLKVALTDAQQLQDSIAEGTEKFFHFGMYVTIQSKDKDELEKIGKNVTSTLASMNVTAKPAVLQQEQGLISTQPLGLDKMFITRNMDTTSLATTFPFVTSELTMDHGIMYGINQHNRSLVIFDRFDMENANTVVFARSGAGKSYFVKLEAVRSLMFGTELIIIDPEKEYERLCQAVGGAYISFSQDKGDKMNPFELSGLGQDEDELRIKMLSLQGFFRLMMGQLNPIEIAILDRALILTYREKGITLDPATQRNADYPLLEDLYKVLKGMAEPEARSMASRLERYIIGSAKGVFNERSTVEINNPFTVFSIRDMADELRPMVMYLMLDYIWTRIRRDMKRRILIVDEAWYMMQNEDSAKFLYGMAKRARKYYLGLTTITQDVDDFLKNDMGRAIITNSSIQFLMKQSPAAIDRLTGTFNLSEGEKQYLLTADKGQGLFFAGANHVAIQVVSSQAEHELITSDPKDLERMRAEEAQGIKKQRPLEELAMMYDPPAVQDPIKDRVRRDKTNVISRAVQSRKEQVDQMIEDRLKYHAVPQSDVNTQGMVDMDGDGIAETYASMSDMVSAERDALQKGRSHITSQGIVGGTVPVESTAPTPPPSQPAQPGYESPDFGSPEEPTNPVQ